MTRTVSKWLALALLLFLLWWVREVLPPFVIAGMLAYILAPLVDELHRRTGVGRTQVAVGVFLVVLGLLAVGAWVLQVRLVREVADLRAQGPDILDTLVHNVTGGETLDVLGQRFTPEDLSERINSAVGQRVRDPGEAFRALRAIVSLGLETLLVLLSLLYFLVDGPRLGSFLLRFVPPEHRPRWDDVAHQIHLVLARYLRGQLFLVGLMSAVTFAVLEWVFHLPYALWLGILTGILEVVPLVGPIIAATLAAIVGFAQGGLPEVGWLLALYFVLRQVEDQFVMSQVVGRAVHVHPLITIFAVLAGEQIGGVLGMILAVPAAATAKVILDYVYPSVELDPAVAVAKAVGAAPATAGSAPEPVVQPAVGEAARPGPSSAVPSPTR